METLKNRWSSKTPKFWKKIQKIGIAAGTIGGVLVASPVMLPATIVSIGGYLLLVGSLTATLSQLTVE